MQAWYIYQKPEWSVSGTRADTYWHLPQLYEIDVIEQSEKFPDRFKIKILDLLWKSPDKAYHYSNGSIYFFPKKDIFVSKTEAIAAHKRKVQHCFEQMSLNLGIITEALHNYDDDLSDEKYISLFTGVTV